MNQQLEDEKQRIEDDKKAKKAEEAQTLQGACFRKNLQEVIQYIQEEPDLVFVCASALSVHYESIEILQYLADRGYDWLSNRMLRIRIEENTVSNELREWLIKQCDIDYLTNPTEDMEYYLTHPFEYLRLAAVRRVDKND